jgi:hypothetical protein
LEDESGLEAEGKRFAALTNEYLVLSIWYLALKSAALSVRVMSPNRKKERSLGTAVMMKRNLQIATMILAAGFLVSQSAVAQGPRLYRQSGNEWIQEISGTFSAGKTVRVKSCCG